MNSTLTVYRPWALARGLRAFSLLVDGVETQALKNGESAVLTLSPGPHSLALRQGRLISHPLELTLGPDEKRELVCAADSGGSFMSPFNTLLGRPSDCLRLLGDDDPQGRYLLAAAKQGVRLYGLEELGAARYVLFPIFVIGLANLTMPPGLDLTARLAHLSGAAVGAALVFFLFRTRPVVVDGVTLKRVARPTFLSRAMWAFPLFMLLALVAGLIVGLSGGGGKARESFMLGLRLSSGFVQSCPVNCERANPGATICPAYCDCMTQALFRGGADIDVPKLYQSRESGSPDAESERKYLAIHQRCGEQALAQAGK